MSVEKPAHVIRQPLTGELCFVGVIRDTDPDGTILGVETLLRGGKGYTISDINVFVADNTAIYNNVISGATIGNVSAYLISFNINIDDPNLNPVLTATPVLNLTGTANAIINQIVPFSLASNPSYATVVYSVIVFGADQQASNDLIEAIFTPTANPFPPNQLLSSCINFTLNFSL